MSDEPQAVAEALGGTAAEQPAQIVPATRAPLALTPRGLTFGSFDELWRFAAAIAEAGEMCPKDLRGRPAAILVALQTGLEVGLTPMFAIRNIAVIHGRASIYGDAFLALCRNCPGWRERGYKEWFDAASGEPAADTAFCQMQRDDGEPQIGKFSIDDAKTAKLWGAKDNWIKHPYDMLMWRARTRVGRRLFADALGGLTTTQEAMDMPPLEATGDPNILPALPAPEDRTPKARKVGAAAAQAAGKPAEAQPVPPPTEAATEAKDAPTEPVMDDARFAALKAMYNKLTVPDKKAVRDELGLGMMEKNEVFKLGPEKWLELAACIESLLGAAPVEE